MLYSDQNCRATVVIKPWLNCCLSGRGKLGGGGKGEEEVGMGRIGGTGRGKKQKESGKM